ncbi:hypothetical protein, partial [Desulfococcus multivorans]|uniref:hypothetical protein n=1 Tax=Desulfococcus multivorans TaxID=897 RepID=UPI001F432186
GLNHCPDSRGLRLHKYLLFHHVPPESEPLPRFEGIETCRLLSCIDIRRRRLNHCPSAQLRILFTLPHPSQNFSRTILKNPPVTPLLILCTSFDAYDRKTDCTDIHFPMFKQVKAGRERRPGIDDVVFQGAGSAVPPEFENGYLSWKVVFQE